MWLSPSRCDVWLCRLDTKVCFLSSAFICVWMIQTRKTYPIRDKKIQSMIVYMLENLSHRYSSHNSNIKCVGFELIHYAIKPYVISSYIAFREFDFVFLSIYC